MIPKLETNDIGNKGNLMIVDLQLQFKRFMMILNIQELNNGYSICSKTSFIAIKSSNSNFTTIFVSCLQQKIKFA